MSNSYECSCPNCPSPTDCEGQDLVEQLEVVTKDRAQECIWRTESEGRERDLVEQLEAMREAVRKGIVYAEACESWPSTPFEKEHYRQEVESMRAALNPAKSPHR